MNNAKIQMLDYEKPILEAGQYQVKIEQSIKGGGIDDTFGSAKTIDFAVTGDRFTLSPDTVYACFPPEGNLGKHTDVLPHISIKRSTLPWERSAYGNEDYEPWVALLLFDEAEIVAEEVIEQTLTLKELQENRQVTLADETLRSTAFPELTLEPGQVDDDKAQVINVKRALLEKVIPSGTELKKLSHVRKRIDSDNNRELAVTVANRMPQQDSESSVYLVSVEGRYNDDGTFNYGTSTADDYIRLVALKKWGFACLPEDGKTFEELVEDIGAGPLSLPAKNSTTPDSTTLDNYLEAGYVPLPHRLRQCDQTYSWYHGPLAPRSVGAKFTDDEALPEFADALISYHQDIGMFDVSYAAAFELGRMLALGDGKFAAALYQWKQQHNEAVLAELGLVEASQLVDAPSRSESSSSDDENELEAFIRQWLVNLHNLTNVPFSYLIPDDALLPDEAIRFFKLDSHWMESLLYGAFSVGGSVRKLQKENTSEKINILKNFYTTENPVSGFIIRSQLISGYPDLQVDTYSSYHPNSDLIPETASNLTVRRIDRIRTDVMIGLFDGDIATLELYLKPEGLKFGLDIEESGLSKDLIQSDNTKISIEPKSTWWRDENNRIVDINTLSQDIQAGLGLTEINSAVFAMQMLDGSNKGRFTIKQL